MKNERFKRRYPYSLFKYSLIQKIGFWCVPLGWSFVSIIANILPCRADVTGNEWLVPSCFYAPDIYSYSDHSFVAVIQNYFPPIVKEKMDPKSLKKTIVAIKVVKWEDCIELHYKQMAELYAIKNTDSANRTRSSKELIEYVQDLTINKNKTIPNVKISYQGYFDEGDRTGGWFNQLTQVKERIGIYEITDKKINTFSQIELYYDYHDTSPLGISLIALLVLIIFYLSRRLIRLERLQSQNK
jgi:hypothetical protein